jgi:SAM-dependent methyltransferase
MAVFDRLLFADSRDWACRRAVGDVLEVAVGTGLNLAHYPPDVWLTGIDFSPAMLRIARSRATILSREIDLREGDAQRLDFPDASFDAVVCTFSLCAIPDERRAVAEMRECSALAGCCWPSMSAARCGWRAACSGRSRP